jgi:hypothetical protein
MNIRTSVVPMSPTLGSPIGSQLAEFTVSVPAAAAAMAAFSAERQPLTGPHRDDLRRDDCLQGRHLLPCSSEPYGCGWKY